MEKLFLKKGFDISDDCGLYITNQVDEQVQNNGESCNSDACLIHLQHLKFTLNISSLTDWKEQTFYSYAKTFGGKVCTYLWSLGLASLVPILINIFYNILVYLEDVASGDATKWESIFLPFAFYPQAKCLKILFQYLIHKDGKRFQRETLSYDKRIGFLEPFLESAFQVSVD